MIRITIHDDPIGKGRPRLTTINGQARAFTPTKTRRWEARASVAVRDALPDGWVWPTEPMAIRVVAVFRRPAALECSHKRKPCRCDREGLRGRLAHTKRPDGDNVLKAVLDAVEKGGAVKDDAIFASITVEKWYAAEGESPRIEIEMRSHRAASRLGRFAAAAAAGAEALAKVAATPAPVFG